MTSHSQWSHVRPTASKGQGKSIQYQAPLSASFTCDLSDYKTQLILPQIPGTTGAMVKYEANPRRTVWCIEGSVKTHGLGAIHTSVPRGILHPGEFRTEKRQLRDQQWGFEVRDITLIFQSVWLSDAGSEKNRVS